MTAWRPKTVLVSITLLLGSCGDGALNEQRQQQLKTVDIPDTEAKWQSIGNCWLYAGIGWLEALTLRDGTHSNYSESFLTYHYFAEQLRYATMASDKIHTGGSWFSFSQLVFNHGLMHEGDFIPGEAHSTFSDRQQQAKTMINEFLAERENRARLVNAWGQDKEDLITQLLDTAFGVKLSDVQQLVLDPRTIEVNDARGQVVTVAEELAAWRPYGDYAFYPPYQPGMPLPSYRGGPTSDQDQFIRYAMAQLNQGQPVVMRWFVDFNAMDDNGIFSLETLAQRGKGKQGYHLTVIEDYVVTYRDPYTGEVRDTPEGEVSPDLKEHARRYGKLKYFVVKNSWGGAEREDRASYTRFGKKGYSRLEASYLLGLMELEEGGAEYGLKGFIFAN